AGIPVICDYHSRSDGKDIVPIVPLLPCGLVLIAPSGDDSKAIDSEGVGDRCKETFLPCDGEKCMFITGLERICRHLVNHVRKHGNSTRIKHGKDGIKVDVCPVMAHRCNDNPFCGTMAEESPCKPLDQLCLRPFAHSDKNGPV